MRPVVVGVVVAAGEATRMGQPKQIMPIGDKPMLQWVVDAAEASKLERVAVVSGYAGDVVRASVRLGRAVWAHNPDPGRGTLSSLRAGMAAVGPADAVVKMVSDQPEIRTSIIDALIETWDPGAHSAALVQYRDGEGHPVMVATEALAEMEDRDGDRLVWRLIEQHPDRLSRLESNQPKPIDVNQPEDYRLLAERLG